MSTIGIIDIGSNSVRMVVAEVYENKAFKVIYEVKKSVRLAKDMTENGHLNSKRVELAIETLKLFKDICEGLHTDYMIAVATAAVRSAANQKYFLERVKEETGIDIRVLSGLEEAYYDFFGIINSMDITDGIIMDIGGASTELVWINNRRLKESISLPFGAITLSEKFNLLDSSNSGSQDSINDFIIGNFETIPWLKEVRGLHLIGIGGTIRNIGKIDRKKKKYPLEVTHNYPLEASDVIDIYNAVKEMNLKQKKKIKGLSKDREDIFFGAISAVKTLINYCNSPTLLVSGSGVREGLIYEYLLRCNEPLENVLDFSLNSLIYMNGLDKTGYEEVWNLSHSLFEQLKPLHKKEDNLLNILKTASFLYNIGINIDYYNNNDHSFYSILNSKINGLTPKEKLIAAHIVGILKKEGIQSNIISYKAILMDEDIDSIKKLAAILKMSVDLNLRRSNNVKVISVNLANHIVIIKITSDKNPAMEIEAAMTIAPDFERIFNKKLIIE